MSPAEPITRNKFRGLGDAMSARTQFGPMLKLLLAQKGMTQAELAGRVRVTQTAVNYWIGGLREPKLSVVCEIADIFDVTVDYLLGRENPPAGDHVERVRELVEIVEKATRELSTHIGPIWNERAGYLERAERAIVDNYSYDDSDPNWARDLAVVALRAAGETP